MTAAPCTEFLCPDGECIPLSSVCDGDIDCLNGQDEVNCTGVYPSIQDKANSYYTESFVVVTLSFNAKMDLADFGVYSKD